MNPALETLLQHPQVWRARHLAPAPALSTGFAALDAELPGGGWPRGAITEILLPQEGIGELRLVLPALAALSQGDRWLTWIAPPHIPYAPALAAQDIDLSRLLLVHPRQPADGLWALEQALRSPTCGAAVGWTHALPALHEHHLRRLQLAAEDNGAWGLLFTPLSQASTRSPAALRLRLEASRQGLVVHILKRRGEGTPAPVSLDLDPRPAQYSLWS